MWKSTHIHISLCVFEKFCLCFKKVYVNVAGNFIFRIVDVLEGQGSTGQCFQITCFSVSWEATGITFVGFVVLTDVCLAAGEETIT
jgi:hypothetical protein